MSGRVAKRARKANAALTDEQRSAAAIKANKTINADPIRYCMRSAILALAG